MSCAPHVESSHLGTTSASTLRALRCVEHTARSYVPRITQHRDVSIAALLTGWSLRADQHDESLRRRLLSAHHRGGGQQLRVLLGSTSQTRHARRIRSAARPDGGHRSATTRPHTTDVGGDIADQNADEAYARLGLDSLLDFAHRRHTSPELSPPTDVCIALSDRRCWPVTCRLRYPSEEACVWGDQRTQLSRCRWVRAARAALRAVARPLSACAILLIRGRLQRQRQRRAPQLTTAAATLHRTGAAALDRRDSRADRTARVVRAHIAFHRSTRHRGRSSYAPRDTNTDGESDQDDLAERAAEHRGHSFIFNK